MTEWINAALDLVLIGMIGVGLVQAVRLIRQLTELKQSRADMERFVRDFNGTVLRAEAGIKNLRTAARDSGDDLEKLVERATLVRDELNFIVESADQLANRITQAASTTVAAKSAAKTVPKVTETAAPPVSTSVDKTTETGAQPASRAEKELLQALQKMK